MSNVMQDVLDLLDLETIEKGIFRGTSRNFFGKNVFGGQVLGQALMAAGRTVEGRLPHSLHGYFLRAGDVKAPIVYQVETIRDGKSFCTRNVKGIQHGENIFLMSASFAVHEEGLDHQVEMPKVQGPDDLPSEHQLRALIAPMIPEKIRAVFERERPVEIRPIDPVNPFAPVKKDAKRHQWMKSQSRLPDDPLLHMCILAFASDFGLMSTAMLPHGVSYMQNNVQAASLDHAMWFHREFRIDEWLLYDMDAPNASGSRGMNFGRVFTQDGKLVATVAQEGLMRLHEVPEKY
ncbi:MAG TPA: acyl-CoA thioesterase II [Candidatus Aquabacterium excrementipullorum]|nr:acyl-CoA thioesterase II [Candidatus Aquabacterium excrementipullorum]